MKKVNAIIEQIEDLGQISKTVNGVTKNLKQLFAEVTEEEKQEIMRELVRRRSKYTEKQKANLANINFFIAKIQCKTEEEIRKTFKEKKGEEKRQKKEQKEKSEDKEGKKPSKIQDIRNKITNKEKAEGEEHKIQNEEEHLIQEFKNKNGLLFTTGDDVYDITGKYCGKVIRFDETRDMVDTDTNMSVSLSILVLPIEETSIPNNKNTNIEVGKAIYAQNGKYVGIVEKFVIDGRDIHAIYKETPESKNSLAPIDTLGEGPKA